ncbi:MAG TPA: type III pantothenate kinase [Arenicellales bacterium]|nr:type III pantothenate kinase [Arenicellales bacterium]
MKLVVDIGNSRLKWARVDRRGLGPGAAVERRGTLESLLEEAFAGTEPPSAALVCSVADEEFNSRLEEWMLARWRVRPRWFKAEDRTLEIVNGYPEPSQLGADRWAAVLGARGLHRPPLAVIDCGTALTLDVVDGDDRHLGGLIAPGVELARRSLLTNTARVRAAAEQAAGLLGRSTAECVANGTRLGLAGAVERWIRDVDERLGGVAWLATGGAWPMLNAEIGHSLQYDPDLVLRGLARVLE